MSRADDAAPYAVADTFVHLRDGGVMSPITVDAQFWSALAGGQLPALDQGRLLSCYRFDADWSSWEMHPAGDELVMLLDGRAEFLLEQANGLQRVMLEQRGEYVLVPPGIWHTARTQVPTTMLFITAGAGTQHRPVA